MRKMRQDAMLRGASSAAFSHHYEYLSSQTINQIQLKNSISFCPQASARKDPLSLIMLCKPREIHRGFIQNQATIHSSSFFSVTSQQEGEQN